MNSFRQQGPDAILKLISLAVLLISGCRDGREPAHKPTPLPVVATPGSLSLIPQNPICFEVMEALPGAFTHHHGESDEYFAILESIGGGVAAIDFDEDGQFDLIVPGGGDLLPGSKIEAQPTGLFRNRGDARYSVVPSSLPPVDFFSQGAAAADFDGDGFTDVLITGYGSIQLLHNSGDGTFRDVTPDSQIVNASWGTSAAWGDLNGDGILDVYIANYLDWSFENNPVCLEHPTNRRDSCSPRSFKPLTDVVFLGNGDGTFRSALQELGFRPGGKGLGVMILDMDSDGDLDLYVANDGEPNFVFQNNGGHFSDISVVSGADRNEQGRPDGSMGLEAGDFNNDLIPDLWVSNYEKESMSLYRSHLDGYYQHVSQQMGIAGIGSQYVGWGICLSDFDGDGDEDAFIATGHANRYSHSAPRFQLPILLENRANERYVNVAAYAGDYFTNPHLGRGVSGGDFDNDGRCDLVVSHQREPVVCLRNTTEVRSNWLGLRLIGRRGTRNPIGARVVCGSGADRQTRFVKNGSSFLSTSDPRLLFYVPAQVTAVSLEIIWPTGVRQPIADLPVGAYHTILEPAE